MGLYVVNHPGFVNVGPQYYFESTDGGPQFVEMIKDGNVPKKIRNKIAYNIPQTLSHNAFQIVVYSNLNKKHFVQLSFTT